jgi:hypothetical protein
MIARGDWRLSTLPPGDLGLLRVFDLSPLIEKRLA